jgi:hypothetical protein
MTNVCVRGWVYLPLTALSLEQVNSFKSLLTYQSPFLNEDGTRKTIYLYKETESALGVPQEWLAVNYPEIFAMSRDERISKPGVFTTLRDQMQIIHLFVIQKHNRSLWMIFYPKS